MRSAVLLIEGAFGVGEGRGVAVEASPGGARAGRRISIVSSRGDAERRPRADDHGSGDLSSSGRIARGTI